MRTIGYYTTKSGETFARTIGSTDLMAVPTREELTSLFEKTGVQAKGVRYLELYEIIINDKKQ